jgi:hypothetical protein
VELNELCGPKGREEVSCIACVLNNLFPFNTVDFVLTPPDVIESSKEAFAELILKASKERYDKVYQEFMQWRVNHQITFFSE